MAKRRNNAGKQRRKQSGGLGVFLLAAIMLFGLWFVLKGWSSAQAGEGSGIWRLLEGLFGAGRARVALVAGHAGHDSGAVCPDGLTEAEINRDVAERTAGLLRRAGYHVDVLEEFDPRLEGYEGDVFISIHSDSCEPDLSGFKVARLPESAVAVQADHLVQALYTEYSVVTGLKPHPNTITFDMTEYHAFREIAPATPGAIIEIGFMRGDRDLLTQHPDLVARGIARGIIAFVAAEDEREGEQTPAATD